ncbi:MAG: CAP domain-containing protein [Ectobacillus sp.]
MRKLFVVLLLTVLILFIDLYGKLLYSQYISLGPNGDKKVIIPRPKNKIEQTSMTAISHLVGRDIESLLAQFGEPVRTEPSAYDYEWWIYNRNLEQYVQFGILNNKIVTIYVAGEAVDISPFRIGQNYADIYAQYPFSYELTLDNSNGSYEFELSETEVNEQPLISLENGWAQLYFDKFTRRLTGIRYMDSETLLKQRPYELIYTGKLLEPAPLSPEQMQRVEQANAKQVLDLTNIIRVRHELPLLKWDEKTAQVAYLHSKDMKESNYFSHESPKFGTLGDRLSRGNVPFRAAGENIAAHYNDGIAAVQGWLNSEGHRKNMLNAEFTGLGVGVYDKYYTQNFIRK